jgi:hypothetical protein
MKATNAKKKSVDYKNNKNYTYSSSSSNTNTNTSGTANHSILFPICANEDEIRARRPEFPIKPDVLINLAKKVFSKIVDIEKNELETYLSDDFEYWGPVVGRASKKQFLKFLQKYQLYKAFPNHRKRTFGWTVDLFEPNRVWFIHRIVGTHTESLGNIKPTYREMELPPTSISITFNVKGLVTKYTSFVMDKSVGNTQGYGGIYGVFAAIGYDQPPIDDLYDEDGDPRSTNKTYKAKHSTCFNIKAWLWKRQIAKRGQT